MQSPNQLFQEQYSFSQAAKNTLKHIDMDALLQSSFCKKLFESFVFLFKHALPISFIEAVRDFPKHVKNCFEAYASTQQLGDSIWEKIQSLFKVFGMFFSPLAALCGSIISFIALLILSIMTTIAMVAAALTKAFIDVLSQILRFDVNKNIFSFFFKLSETLLFKAPYEFFKASFSKMRSWFTTATASETTNDTQPHFEFNFFKFSSFIVQKTSLQQLFSVLESLQETLASEGLSVNDIFQGEHQAKAILAAIEELSRQGFATQGNPALTTIAQAADIFLGTAGTTASIERQLPVTLEAIALGLQRSQESYSSVGSWDSTNLQKDRLFQHAVPGFVEKTLSSNDAFNLLLQHRDKINDFLEVVELLVAPQDNTLNLKRIAQKYSEKIVAQFGRPADAVAIDEHVDRALAALRQARFSEKVAIVQRLISAITPAELHLDTEQQQELECMQQTLKKDFLEELKLEHGILEHGLARLIIAKLHNKILPVVDATEDDAELSVNNLGFIKIIMHRLNQATADQQELVMDLVIAQVFPSFDERKSASAQSSAQELSAIEAFNAQRSYEKNKLKSLMLKVIHFSKNPQQLFEHVESDELEVLRQPEHQSMIRILGGFGLYQAYNYSSAAMTADRDQQIRAGLLDAPVSFQHQEWVKHLTAIRNASLLESAELIESAISELLPHLNMVIDLHDLTGVKLEQARKLNALRLEKKEEFKLSLLELTQQPLSVSTSELANKIFGFPVYDYYRTSKDWMAHEGMGSHFLDDLMHVAINHSGLSSAKLLDIMRNLSSSTALTKSQRLAQVADIVLAILGPTTEDTAAGAHYHRAMVKDFMQKNQAGLLRFMSKLLLKACPPSDLPTSYSEKKEAITLLEEQLTDMLNKTINNSAQIEELSIGLVKLALALKNNDAESLHEAAIKLSPMLAALLENIPADEVSAANHGLASYMRDIDSTMRTAIGFNQLPQLSTLSRYQRLGAHYGVGLNRVLPVATYAWKGYNWAYNYTAPHIRSFREKALNQSKSFYAYSVEKASEVTAAVTTKCRETVNQVFVAAKETITQTQSAISNYCQSSFENAMNFCTQYCFSSSYKTLFSSAATTSIAADKNDEGTDKAISLSLQSALLFSGVHSFSGMSLFRRKFR